MAQDLRFGLDVSIDDQTGKPRAAYLRVRDGDVAETREVVPGRAFADYNADDLLVGIEFLAPCSIEVVDQLTQNEPAPVQQFFRTTLPRELVTA